MKELQVGNW